MERRKNASASISNVVTFEPERVYHDQSKEFLSSHKLGDFRKSPWLYRKKQLELIPDVDRPAYLIGRVAHTLILEGREVYGARYAIGGPVNPKTGNPYGATTKAFTEWANSVGKPVLTHEQAYLIEQIDEGVRMNEAAMELLSTGIAEGVVRRLYCDMSCQIRIDWLNPDRGIVDLKTCDDLTWFEADARRYGYAHQLAFYRAVLSEALGVLLPVQIIAVEKREPFRCGVWRLGEELLGQAQKENEAAISYLKRCRESDQWPTGYEAIRPLTNSL